MDAMVRASSGAAPAHITRRRRAGAGHAAASTFQARAAQVVPALATGHDACMELIRTASPPDRAAASAQRRLAMLGALERTLGATPRDDSRPIVGQELHGEPDGAPAKLPSGVLVYRRRLGERRVGNAEFLQACRGLAQLPTAHQQALARAGVPVYLVPSAGLEDGLLGATTIVQDTDGAAWRPTLVRVAVQAGRDGAESTPEILQHEVGHVIAVLTGQDRSEAAAESYARRY